MTRNEFLSVGGAGLALILAAIALVKSATAPAATPHSQAIDISTVAPGRCTVIPQQPTLTGNDQVYFHADDQHTYYIYANASACGTPASATAVAAFNVNNGNSNYWNPSASDTFIVCDDENPSQICSGGGAMTPNIGVRIRP